MGVGDESNDDDEECVYEGTNRLQESYNSILEKNGECTRVAKTAIRKMKKAEHDYKSILVRYKEAKCEVEGLNEEPTNAYSLPKKKKKNLLPKAPLRPQKPPLKVHLTFSSESSCHHCGATIDLLRRYKMHRYRYTF